MDRLAGAPGVRIVEVTEPAVPALASGVPGFVGVATPRRAQAAPVLALDQRGDFDTLLRGVPGGHLAGAVAAFFDNGGRRCHVAWADPVLPQEAALADALERLAGVDEIDLVTMPDAMLLHDGSGAVDRAAALRLQRRLLGHATRHAGRFALLDAWPGAGADSVIAQREALVRGLDEPIDGALYHPWLRSFDGRLAPPCGAVCGVVARCDAQAGVFKAPANEELFGVLDLESVLDDATQGELHRNGINALRALPGRGIRVWGARTLGRDPAWRQVNARRLVLHLERWIDRHLAGIVFEPHGPTLWTRIQRELGARLEGLWRAGALQGASPDEAFFVKCDEELNPPERRDLGEVCTEIGLAITVPAEYVVVRLVQRPGSRELDRS